MTWRIQCVMRYVFFLMLNNGQVYKGTTEDLKRRMMEHERGKVSSTRNRRPVILIGYEAYQLVRDADRRERYLKTTEGIRLLRQQYRDVIQKYRGEVPKLVEGDGLLNR